MTSSIIKLDRPYPIVYYKGRLLLQVGTLLVVSEKHIGRNHNLSGLYQEAYPILSYNNRQFGNPLCDTILDDAMFICRENEELELTDATQYLEWDCDYADGKFNFELLSTLQDFNCSIRHIKDIDGGEFNIELFMDEQRSGKQAVKAWAMDGSLFFYAEIKGTIPETAQQLIEEIKFYSQYIDAENFTWTFTSEIPRDEPYINKLNEYISIHLMDSATTHNT